MKSKRKTQSRTKKPALARAATRFAAYIIDGLLISIITLIAWATILVLSVLTSGQSESLVIALVLGYLSSILLSVYWFIVVPAQISSTYGMKLVDLKYVRKNDNKNVTYRETILRYIGLILTGFTLGIGFLLILFRDDKQALHDIIAGTLVVKRK